MNQHPSQSKDNKSSYDIYFGKHSVSQSECYCLKSDFIAGYEKIKKKALKVKPIH
jgi:hypothetical protein